MARKEHLDLPLLPLDITRLILAAPLVLLQN